VVIANWIQNLFCVALLRGSAGFLFRKTGDIPNDKTGTDDLH
jgi:hypothetical protein